MDAIYSNFDIRDYKIKTVTNIPETYIIDPQPEIKNQGLKSTCVPHALSSIFEFHYSKQHTNKVRFSTEFLYGYRLDSYYQKEGMRLRDALNTALTVGDVPEDVCPGNNSLSKAKKNVTSNIDSLVQAASKHKISAYFRCRSNDEIKSAIITTGPVITIMSLYKGATLSQDIYKWDKSSSITGQHCILIIGWNKDGWIIQNSWGRLYGGDGRFILPYAFPLGEKWGTIDDYVEEIIVTKPRINSKIAILINATINFLLKIFKKKLYM